MRTEVVILGCGYTGSRVAQRFLNRGAKVIAYTRSVEKLLPLSARGARIRSLKLSESPDIPEGSLVLHSVPIVGDGSESHDVTDVLLKGASPARVVYLSTTGVYGATRDVDEKTPADPRDERARLRIQAEDYVEAGDWSSLILRPAAIYGPGRGIHVSMQEGRFHLAGAGDNFVSRIHVDDLASHVEAGLLSRVEGRFPVADLHPCPSREIAEFCARLLNLPQPLSAPPDDLHLTRRADRRVDGSAIRLRLAVELRFPSYTTGIPASTAHRA